MKTPPGERRHDGLLARLTRLCARHAWWTLAVWLLLLLGVAGSALRWGGTLTNNFSLPASETQRATDLLASRFPSQAGDSAQVIFTASRGLTTASTKATVQKALRSTAGVPGVVGVGNPYAGQGGAISRSGTIGFAYVQFQQQAAKVPGSSVTAMEDRINAAVAGHGITVAYSGQVIQAQKAISTGSSLVIGVLAALVVLLLVFGTVVAAGLPIVLALFSVGLGSLQLLLLAAVGDFNIITPALAGMIGPGVGVDYSLFIITRFHQVLHEGLSPEDAAATAGATAGRAVVFAGLTVAVSVCGLAVIGVDFVTKMGVGAALTVLTTVGAAVTLLPAVLRLLGHRIDRLRVPFIRVRDESDANRESSLVARWGRFVTSHARLMAMASLLVVGVIAIPVTGVHLGTADAGSDPKGSSSRQAYDLLAAGFGPGFNGPLLVALDTHGNKAVAAELAAALRRDPDVAAVPAPVLNPAGDTAQITVFPRTSPQSTATSDLVSRLREKVIPPIVAGTGAHAYVGGQTAANDDLAASIFSRIPVFLIVVVGIIFLILTMAFRSVVIALKAALTTLGSALAAFGALVLVFQQGVGLGLIGLDRGAPIQSFVPVILFAVLFGLAMDYEVFLVSRMRDEYVHGDTPRGAITHGVAANGRVVVAAAAIMGLVFFSFLLGGDRNVEEFGLALGVAVVVDAFIVRLTLVPAIMHLLGRHAWYIPRWLDRVLPHLTIEAPAGETRELPTAAASRSA